MVTGQIARPPDYTSFLAAYAGAVIQPLIFWLVIGSGFGGSVTAYLSALRRIQLTERVKFDAWTYNGTVPGPIVSRSSQAASMVWARSAVDMGNSGMRVSAPPD